MMIYFIFYVIYSKKKSDSLDTLEIDAIPAQN